MEGTCTLSEMNLDYLPITKRVYPSFNLYNQDKIASIKERIIINNRDGKIDLILNGTEFNEIILEEDDEYKKETNFEIRVLPPPSSCLFTLKKDK